MNWNRIRAMTHEQIGAFLALLIVAFSPNYGIEKFGPSPVVAAFLLFVLGVWLIWRERLALFVATAQKRWLVIFLLLFVPTLVSVPQSYQPRISLSIAGVLLLYYFAGAALIRALRADVERARLVKWIAVVLLFWLVDGYLQLLSGHDLFGIPRSDDGRVLGPFAENLHLSVLLVLLLPVLLVWLWPRGLVVVLAGFVASGVIALLGGSRAALFFLAVIAIGLFLRVPGGRRKWLAAAALVVIAGVTVALSPVLQERFARFETLRSPSFETMDRLLSQRLTIWDTASHMVSDRPLTGVGAGAFQAAYRHYSTRPGDVFLGPESRAYHAHQLYVGIAAETGLPGLVAFCLIVILGAKWYWSTPAASRSRAWPFALGLATYIFPINSQPPLFTQWLFPVILLLLAGFLSALDEPGAGAAAAKPV